MTGEKNTQQSNQELDLIEKYEKQLLIDFQRLKQYVRQEPAVVLSGLYLLTSLAGLLHLFFLLERFSVNILPHLELSDFLLGAIYYPNIFLYFFGFMLAVVMLILVDRWIRKRVSLYRKLLLKTPESFYAIPLSVMMGLMSFLYLYNASVIEAKNNYHDIVTPNTANFTLHFEAPTLLGDREITVLSSVKLIADLSKHLWIYDPSVQEVYALPHDSVVVMEVLPESEGEQ